MVCVCCEVCWLSVVDNIFDMVFNMIVENIVRLLFVCVKNMRAPAVDSGIIAIFVIYGIIIEIGMETTDKRTCQFKEQRNPFAFAGCILAAAGIGMMHDCPAFVIVALGLILSVAGLALRPRILALLGVAVSVISIQTLLDDAESMKAEDGGQGAFITVSGATEALPRRMEWVEIRGRKGYASVHIGMPKDSVKMLVGRPNKVDLRQYGGSVAVETWKYRINSKYTEDLVIEIRDGKLERVTQY